MHCSTFTLHIKHSAPPSQLSLRHISDFNITPPPSLLSGIKHREICRQLPPTLCLLKDSLPKNSSPAAPEKPTTLVRSCSAQPLEPESSRALNTALYIRFSFGQMLFASEAAATCTQTEIWAAGCTSFLQDPLQLFNSSQLKLSVPNLVSAQFIPSFPQRFGP